MNATLLTLPIESPQTLPDCEHCPTVQRLVTAMERLLAEHQKLLTDYRRDVNYWKKQHARAVQRCDQLKEKVEQLQGEVRGLRAERFGRKSEKSSKSDRSNDLSDPEEEAKVDKKKRGAQLGHAGHDRRDYSNLPVEEEDVELPLESRCCPHCGKPAVEMSDTEDSEVVEIEVQAYRRQIHRKRYRVTCNCNPACRTLTAPLSPKLIPKSIYGISIWVLILLDKFASFRPTERLLGQLEQYGLALSAGTVNGGLKKIEPLFQPIYKALCERNRQGDLHQADETRWRVFVVLAGKKGYGWWLWVILGKDTVIYLLSPSRGHEVPQSHFGPIAQPIVPKASPNVMEVDRYAGYKAMMQVKAGLILLAFCWAHVRRDFVRVGKGWEKLIPWALTWLRRIRQLYHINRERLRHEPSSLAFQEQDALLRQAVETMRVEAAKELANPKLRQPCRKVLTSLQEHWSGLVLFVDDPRIPMDNNASERQARGPAVARKNFYGSGSLWSGRLTAAMFSLFATLARWNINPRKWLTWYFESCAAAGGTAPDNIEPFLPWNLSDEKLASLALRSPPPATDHPPVAADTS